MVALTHTRGWQDKAPASGGIVSRQKGQGKRGRWGWVLLVCSGIAVGLGTGKRGSVTMLYGDVMSYKGDERRGRVCNFVLCKRAWERKGEE
jgi:hypothetical protein